MSRLDDLIDLIQTTNEVYFITAPGRVRTAYILVDDITELALKSYLGQVTLEYRKSCQEALENAGLVTKSEQRFHLQRYFVGELEKASLHSELGLSGPDVGTMYTELNNFDKNMLRHWSINDPNARKDFYIVVDEVKNAIVEQATRDLLDRMLDRHRQRNKFFHDHHQSGLTVDDDKCLRALCDLFTFMENMFPDFLPKVKDNKTVRCQIGVLRLKLAAHGSNDLREPYNQALEEFGNQTLNRWSDNFEHSILHTVSLPDT